MDSGSLLRKEMEQDNEEHQKEEPIMKNTITTIKQTYYLKRETDVFTSGIPRFTFTFDWYGMKQYLDEVERKKVFAILKELRKIGFYRSDNSQHAFGTEYRTSHTLSPEIFERIKVLAEDLTRIIFNHQKDTLEWVSGMSIFKAEHMSGVKLDGLYVGVK